VSDGRVEVQVGEDGERARRGHELDAGTLACHRGGGSKKARIMTFDPPTRCRVRHASASVAPPLLRLVLSPRGRQSTKHFTMLLRAQPRRLRPLIWFLGCLGYRPPYYGPAHAASCWACRLASSTTWLCDLSAFSLPSFPHSVAQLRPDYTRTSAHTSTIAFIAVACAVSLYSCSGQKSVLRVLVRLHWFCPT
jgi:hypothetical protein